MLFGEILSFVECHDGHFSGEVFSECGVVVHRFDEQMENVLHGNDLEGILDCTDCLLDLIREVSGIGFQAGEDLVCRVSLAVLT